MTPVPLNAVEEATILNPLAPPEGGVKAKAALEAKVLQAQVAQ